MKRAKGGPKNAVGVRSLHPRAEVWRWRPSRSCLLYLANTISVLQTIVCWFAQQRRFGRLPPLFLAVYNRVTTLAESRTDNATLCCPAHSGKRVFIQLAQVTHTHNGCRMCYQQEGEFTALFLRASPRSSRHPFVIIMPESKLSCGLLLGAGARPLRQPNRLLRTLQRQKIGEAESATFTGSPQSPMPPIPEGLARTCQK